MKKLTVIAFALVFAMAAVACGGKKKEAPPEGAKIHNVDKGEADKGEADKGEADKGEADKGEADKGEADKGDGVTDAQFAALSETCKKVVACQNAWAKDGTGVYQEIVTTGWADMKADYVKHPDHAKLGCPTALKSWAGYEGAPAACK